MTENEKEAKELIERIIQQEEKKKKRDIKKKKWGAPKDLEQSEERTEGEARKGTPQKGAEKEENAM